MSSKATAERIEGDAPGPTKAQVLDKVFSLATQFSTCVEAFNLIHPSKESDHAQRVALAKLGVQQSRLLIFGDAVGISAPPATIARHMIPSHPGLTNPDPHLPVNFGVRDDRLDNDAIHEKVRQALNEIAGRPGHLSRDELMEKYGLKSPKRFNMLEHPALDTNRMEAFREKYGLLQDLVRESGARANIKRSMSMTTNHWTVKDTTKFDEFVKAVRAEVDGLIDLLGVNEQVDRGMKSDIRSMAWHPELSGPVVQQDWEKLRLIREACEANYPQYIEVADRALLYLNEELRETVVANRRASLGVPPMGGAAGARRKSDYELRAHPEATQTTQTTQKRGSTGPEEKTAIQLAAEGVYDPQRRPSNSKKNSYNSQKEKRPGWLSAFKFKSWSKGHKHEKERSNSLPEDPVRSLSVPENEVLDTTAKDDGFHSLEPVRSKSVGEIPSGPAVLDLDSRLQDLSVNDKGSVERQAPKISVDSPNRATFDQNELEQIKTVSSDGMQDYVVPATTANSQIDRHDMYKGMGRIETKDIRNIAHTPRGGFE